jgi:hypothetical protein
MEQHKSDKQRPDGDMELPEGYDYANFVIPPCLREQSPTQSQVVLWAKSSCGPSCLVGQVVLWAKSSCGPSCLVVTLAVIFSRSFVHPRLPVLIELILIPTAHVNTHVFVCVYIYMYEYT